MTEILLYDYTALVDDGWWGAYEQFYCIGMGNLTAQAIQGQINAAAGDDLLVRVNSVGGSVFDGFAIYNALKASTGKVTIRIEGLAASIASIIAMAASPGQLVICQAAMMMIHKPTIDPFWCGTMDANDLQREADALNQIEAVLNDIYTSRTGLGATKISNMIDSETWLTPDMATMLGFADSIEKTITEQPEIVTPVFNHLFKNANAQTKAYANNAFKIKNMATKNPNDAVIEAVKEQTKATNSLLDWFKNSFNWKKDEVPGSAAKNASATLANGNPIYYNDGEEFAVGTEVFNDADMADPCADGEYEMSDSTKITVAEGKLETVADAEIVADNSAEITTLKDQLAAKETALNEAKTALTAANETLTKIKNMKSSYVPPKNKTEFNNAGKEVSETDGKGAVERYNERHNKKKATA